MLWDVLLQFQHELSSLLVSIISKPLFQAAVRNAITRPGTSPYRWKNLEPRPGRGFTVARTNSTTKGNTTPPGTVISTRTDIQPAGLCWGNPLSTQYCRLIPLLTPTAGKPCRCLIITNWSFRVWSPQRLRRTGKKTSSFPLGRQLTPSTAPVVATAGRRRRPRRTWRRTRLLTVGLTGIRKDTRRGYSTASCQTGTAIHPRLSAHSTTDSTRGILHAIYDCWDVRSVELMRFPPSPHTTTTPYTPPRSLFSCMIFFWGVHMQMQIY